MGGGFDRLARYADQVLASGRVGSVLASAIAVVLIFAGLSKLRMPLPAAQALVDFGVARRVRVQFAHAHGVFELVLGAALIVPLFPVVFRSIALGLLSIFTFVVGRAVLHGDPVACRCFGHAEDVVSASTVARNAVLALGGLVALITALRSNEPQQQDLGVFVAGSAVVAYWALLGTIPRLARWNSDTRTLLRERKA